MHINDMRILNRRVAGLCSAGLIMQGVCGKGSKQDLSLRPNHSPAVQYAVKRPPPSPPRDREHSAGR